MDFENHLQFKVQQHFRLREEESSKHVGWSSDLKFHRPCRTLKSSAVAIVATPRLNMKVATPTQGTREREREREGEREVEGMAREG